jgi:hypothetical protein
MVRRDQHPWGRGPIHFASDEAERALATFASGVVVGDWDGECMGKQVG